MVVGISYLRLGATAISLLGKLGCSISAFIGVIWHRGNLVVKRGTAEMGGEALREAGTLIIVFAPLYDLFESSKQKWGIFP